METAICLVGIEALTTIRNQFPVGNRSRLYISKPAALPIFPNGSAWCMGIPEGMALRNRFQQTLTRALADAGFQSIAEAARAAGVPYDTLQKAVSGAIVPTPAIVRKLAKQLELDANRLVRTALEARVVGMHSSRDELDAEWEAMKQRAVNLGPESERALLERMEWFLRGAETQHRSGRLEPRRRR